MSKEQIIINDKEINLGDGVKIALTSQINDLSELKDHQSTLSNNIKVPLSDGNKQAVEHSEQVQTNSVVPYRKNRTRVVKNGVDVIRNGYTVLSSSDSNLNLAIYEGNVDFFESIEGKRLYDLDLSDLDHSYDLATIIGFNAATSGVKYSLINYGYFTNTNRIIDAKNVRPSIFAFELLNRIIQDSGFTADGSVLTNEMWLREIIPFTNSQNPDLWFNNTIYDLVAGDYSAINASDPIAYLNGQPATAGIPPTYHYNYDVNVYLRFKITASTGTNYLKIDIQGNSGSAATETTGGGDGIDDVSFNRSAIGSGPLTLKLTIRNCTVEILGGRFYGTITPRDLAEGGPEDFSVFVTKKSIVGGNTPETIFVGLDKDGGEEYYEPFAMQNFLPDMTQKEFVKWFAQQFHVMFKTNKLENKIYLKQFKEIVADIPTALNWTNKLNRDDFKNRLGYRIDGYAQTNYCKYTPDVDDIYIKKETGDGSIIVDDETLAKEKTVLEFPFAATKMELMLQDLDIPRINKLDVDGLFTVDTVPRVLLDDTLATLPDDPITYENGATDTDISTDVPLCHFILKDQTFNLGFNNSILLDNYSALTHVLNKSKRLIVQLKLSALDFYNLDHFRPIYLHQFSAYFYINKVMNWTGEGLTKVEIIRIGQRNNALVGARTRYRASYNPVSLYGQINRDWTTAMIVTLSLQSLVIDGIQYATGGQKLIIDSSSDLVVGVGIDGNMYVTNVSDWITSLMPDGYIMRDNGLCFDMPTDSSFDIQIYYEETGPLGDYGLYRYNNNGFYTPDDFNTPYEVYTQELL